MKRWAGGCRFGARSGPVALKWQPGLAMCGMPSGPAQGGFPARPSPLALLAAVVIPSAG